MYCHIFLFLLLSVFILACHQHGFPQKRFPKRCTRRSGPKRLICGRWGCPDNPPVGKQATTVISPHPRAGEVSFHRRRPLTMAFITPSDTLYMSRCSSHLLLFFFLRSLFSTCTRRIQARLAHIRDFLRLVGDHVAQVACWEVTLNANPRFEIVASLSR